MKVLVVGYWVWFGISVIVLSRRLIMRMAGGPRGGRASAPGTGADATSATAGTPSPQAAGVAGAPIEDLASRVAARLAAQAPEAAAEPAPAIETSIETAVDPVVDDAAPGEPTTEVDAPAALAGTVFAPRPPAPTRSSVSGARTSLAEVLRGMAMPADLAPLVHVAGADPTRRAVFCTTGLPVERVGAEVAEELLRLGFVLEPTSTTDALARRGDDALTVRMRAIGPQPQKGPADPAYPTAPAGSVVLDVELA